MEISCAAEGSAPSLKLLARKLSCGGFRPEIIENIGFRRIEHSEGAANHGVSLPPTRQIQCAAPNRFCRIARRRGKRHSDHRK